MVKKKETQKKKIEKAITRAIPDSDALQWLCQPNNLTYLRGDMNLPQLKAFNELIDVLQTRMSERLRGGKDTLFDDEDFVRYPDEPNVKGEVFRIEISMSELTVPTKYGVIEEVVKRLASMTFGFKGTLDGEEGVFYTKIFETIFMPKEDHTYKNKKRRSGRLVFFIPKNYYKEIWKISSYTRYLKQVVNRCQSQFSIRIYMFLAAQKRRGMDDTEWLVEYPMLHSMLGFSTYKPATKNTPMEWNISHYGQYRDFKRRVLVVAQEELNAMAETQSIDITFEYEEIYPAGKKRGEPEKIRFVIRKTDVGKTEDGESLYARDCIQARKDMMYSFDMTKSQCDQVMYIVTEDTLPLLRRKIRELTSYLSSHSEVQDKTIYALKSLKAALLDAMKPAEAEEIKEPAPTSSTPHPGESKETSSLTPAVLTRFAALTAALADCFADTITKNYIKRLTLADYDPDKDIALIAVENKNEVNYLEESVVRPHSALVSQHFKGVGYKVRASRE